MRVPCLVDSRFNNVVDYTARIIAPSATVLIDMGKVRYFYVIIFPWISHHISTLKSLPLKEGGRPPSQRVSF